MDIQRLSALISLDSPQKAQGVTTEPQQGPSFGEMLETAIQQVEQDQKNANTAAVQLASGETTDIAQVMIASERANLSLGLALQVRNKMIEAYQEIMRMPL